VVNVRIRGIYSTALTSLLLRNNFKVVQPSATISERFNLPKEGTEKSLLTELDIYDRLDRQGVNAVGDEYSVMTFVELLKSTLDDAVFRRRLSLYSESSTPSNQAYFETAIQETSMDKEPLSLGGRTRINIEFPGSSKRTLDSFRALVTPTLERHHYYKACSGGISSLLEMAEKMLKKDCPKMVVETLLRESVERELPREGSRISIEHVKISGRVFHLGPAEIMDFDERNGKVRLLRTFTRTGIYDALRIRKNPGDYAVTEMILGDWSFKTRYFSKDGKYKGTYTNINTPIEMYPGKIRYVDLEVDVCLWSDGKIKKVDQEKLEERVAHGYVSGKLVQIVGEKMEKIIDSLSPNVEKNDF